MNRVALIFETLGAWRYRAKRILHQAVCEHRESYTIDLDLGEPPFVTHCSNTYCRSCDKTLSSKAHVEPIRQSTVSDMPVFAPREYPVFGHE